MTATLATDGLSYWARNAPACPAIVFDGLDTIDYSSLDGWTERIAEWLVTQGVKAGDRVGIIGPNSLEWCAGALGAIKAGAIAVGFNYRFLTNELRQLVEDCDPKLVLAAETHLSRMAEVASARTFQLLSLDEVRDLREGPPTSVHEHIPVDRMNLGSEQPAVIVFTSGTTAKPKGVIFTHRTITSFITELALMEPGVGAGTRMVFVLSLSTAAGFLWAILHMTTRGGTVFLEKGFEPDVALKRIVEEQIEILMGPPILFDQISRQPAFESANLSSLKLVQVGGAKVSLTTLEAWGKKGVTIRQIYGMTEVGGISTTNPIEEAVRHPEAVGRGSIFTKHRVVRPDGSDCDPEEIGEIIIRGPSVTPGYWRNEEASRASLVDGWFHSGDIGTFDKNGLLRMVDRSKDMIISGGFNIAPSEIESVISSLPEVDEVAVVAVPDEKFGETVAAMIYSTGELSAKDVVDHCSGILADYKVPRYVVFVNEPFSRNLLGKISKADLRSRAADIPSTNPRVR